jgi:hypothetical protein
VALKRRHAGQISGDYADFAWVLAGSIGHGVLEQASGRIPAQTAIERLQAVFAAEPDLDHLSDVRRLKAAFRAVQTVLRGYEQSMLGDIQEIRLYAEVHGQLISGQPDLLRSLAKMINLGDWKFCSRWATLDGVKIEYEAQLNFYRWLCHQNRDLLISRGMDPDKISSQTLFAWYKDWSLTERRKRGEDYPEFQIETFDVDMWEMPVIDAYVHGRVEAHLEAEKRLPECTDKERWEDPSGYAVINTKKGTCVKANEYENGKKRPCTELEAQAYILEKAQPENYEIEFRQGRPKRCEDGWCPVAPFCSQYQAQFQPGSRPLLT